MLNGSSPNSNKDKSSLFRLKRVWIIPDACSAPKRLTNKTRLFQLIVPGRIVREDYRQFSWSGYVNYEITRKQAAGMENLMQRVERYLENRSGHEIRLENRKFVLEFQRLDDARMFVLSFSDVIETNGVKFD